MARRRTILFFVIIMLMYFLIRIVRNHTDNVFISSYATDVLFVPAAGLFSLFFVRILKRDNQILIPWYQILVFVLFTSWYFEWYLPKKGYYVSDIWDVVMYFLGGIVFYFSQRFTLL